MVPASSALGPLFCLEGDFIAFFVSVLFGFIAFFVSVLFGTKCYLCVQSGTNFLAPRTGFCLERDIMYADPVLRLKDINFLCTRLQPFLQELVFSSA